MSQRTLFAFFQKPPGAPKAPAAAAEEAPDNKGKKPAKSEPEKQASQSRKADAPSSLPAPKRVKHDESPPVRNLAASECFGRRSSLVVPSQPRLRRSCFAQTSTGGGPTYTPATAQVAEGARRLEQPTPSVSAPFSSGWDGSSARRELDAEERDMERHRKAVKKLGDGELSPRPLTPVKVPRLFLSVRTVGHLFFPTSLPCAGASLEKENAKEKEIAERFEFLEDKNIKDGANAALCGNTS